MKLKIIFIIILLLFFLFWNTYSDKTASSFNGDVDYISFIEPNGGSTTIYSKQNLRYNTITSSTKSTTYGSQEKGKIHLTIGPRFSEVTVTGRDVIFKNNIATDRIIEYAEAK